MTEQLNIAERIWSAVWQYHFHIPETVYWATLICVAMFFSFATPAAFLAGAFFLALALQGIIRWQWHRRSSSLIVIPMFTEVESTTRRAREVQRIIVSSLSERLTADEMKFVHTIPVRLSRDQRSLAAWLRRKLGCYMLVYGRISSCQDGSYSVFAGTMEAVDREVTHVDWITRDRTTSRARWSKLFQRLTPAQQVIDEEFPFEFADELEAIVRSVSGIVKLLFEELDAAEAELRSAINVAPSSTSHQIDQLRIHLAQVMELDGRQNEALAFLRERVVGESPSSALLRAFDGIAFIAASGESDETIRNELAHEAAAGLRRAVEQRSDPQRDMSLYNLGMRLSEIGEDAESDQVLLELYRSSRYYSRTWYLARQLGATCWFRRDYENAARWYARAIRRRPRAMWVRTGRFKWRRLPIPRLPLLHANCRDACQESGHRARAIWHELRFQLSRSKLMRNGRKVLDTGEVAGAFASFDWCFVGRQDEVELNALILGSISAFAAGDDLRAFKFVDETSRFDGARIRTQRDEALERWPGLVPVWQQLMDAKTPVR